MPPSRGMSSSESIPELSSACHIECCQEKYHKWAQDNKYESKLPGDIKKHKDAAELVTRTLDRDLKEKKLGEQVVKYTDKAFRQAALEWLVATDQVG